MLFDQHNTGKLLSFTKLLLEEWLLLIGRFEFEQLFLSYGSYQPYLLNLKLLTITSETFVERTIIIIL